MFLEFVSVRLDNNTWHAWGVYYGMRVSPTPVSAEPIHSRQSDNGEENYAPLNSLRVVDGSLFAAFNRSQPIVGYCSLYEEEFLFKNSAFYCFGRWSAMLNVGYSHFSPSFAIGKIVFCPLHRDMIAHILEIKRTPSLSLALSVIIMFSVRKFMVFEPR